MYWKEDGKRREYPEEFCDEAEIADVYDLDDLDENFNVEILCDSVLTTETTV